MNPRIIKLLMKGHQEKLKERDYMAWLSWQYGLSAVSVAVERNLAGRKARSKYVEKPFMHEVLGDETNNGYAESREQVAVFEMKQRINMLRQQGLPESPA